MNKLAIRAEDLGKAYQIGLKDGMPDTLFAAAAKLARAPLTNLRRLHRLDTHSAGGKRADLFWALRDVNFTVNRGEVLGIIGQNGAGKSTLLKILSRITEPTTGRARIRGRVSSLLEVGTGFHPELTGRENIYMNGTILGMKKREIDRKFDRIVDFSGIETFLDTPIKRYSSGMKVRLAFSVAAHLEPEILVIDEVLAVGDAAFQRKCLGKMGGIAQGGRTVLFVSHNMPAVQNLCGRVLVLTSGAITFDGGAMEGTMNYLQQAEAARDGNDLKSLPRRDTHEPVLKKLVLLDRDRQVVNRIQSADALTAVIHYDHHQPIDDPGFGMTFDTATGVSVFTVSSRFQRAGIKRAKSTGTATCHIPKVALVPGTYYISAWCTSCKHKIDHVDHACRLEVLEHDVFGTGILPNSRNALVMVDATWQFDSPCEPNGEPES